MRAIAHIFRPFLGMVRMGSLFRERFMVNPYKPYPVVRVYLVTTSPLRVWKRCTVPKKLLFFETSTPFTVMRSIPVKVASIEMVSPSILSEAMRMKGFFI